MALLQNARPGPRERSHQIYRFFLANSARVIVFFFILRSFIMRERCANAGTTFEDLCVDFDRAHTNE